MTLTLPSPHWRWQLPHGDEKFICLLCNDELYQVLGSLDISTGLGKDKSLGGMALNYFCRSRRLALLKWVKTSPIKVDLITNAINY
jgi:hypothetical protein